MDTPASNADAVEEAIPMESNGLKMSARTKMYDVNGDGFLDETEKAMYDMDKSGKGFISNDKVYELMKGHVETQKELFRFKKVVIALTAFVVLLALSNLGTSFAAAYLAKDTSTNKNDQLVNSDTDQAVSTQTTADEVEVTLVDEAERRRLCSLTSSTATQDSYVECKGTSYLNIYSPKINLLQSCSRSRTVKMVRTWKNGSKTEKAICSPSVLGTYSSDGTFVEFENGIILRRQGNSYYSVDGDAFTQDAGMICDVTEDCDEGLTCTSNVCA